METDKGLAQWLFSAGFISALILAGITLTFSAYYLNYFMSATSASVAELFAGSSKPMMEDLTPTISDFLNSSKEAQPDEKIVQMVIKGILDSQREAQIDEASLRLGIVARMMVAKMCLISCGIHVGMSFGFLGFALFLLGVKGEMDVNAKSEGYQVKIARISPGVFVILCAAILIGVCVTQKMEFKYFLQQKGNKQDTALSSGATPSDAKHRDILEKYGAPPHAGANGKDPAKGKGNKDKEG
jgi:hypothetical protein